MRSDRSMGRVSVFAKLGPLEELHVEWRGDGRMPGDTTGRSIVRDENTGSGDRVRDIDPEGCRWKQQDRWGNGGMYRWDEIHTPATGRKQ